MLKSDRLYSIFSQLRAQSLPLTRSRIARFPAATLLRATVLEAHAGDALKAAVPSGKFFFSLPRSPAPDPYKLGFTWLFSGGFAQKN